MALIPAIRFLPSSRPNVFLLIQSKDHRVTDADLEVDNMEQLNQHRPWPGSDSAMMFRALYYKARKCFKAILNEREFEEWNYLELTSLFHKSIKHDFG